MQKLLFATAATVGLAVAISAATPAFADPYWDDGVGVHVGPFGLGVGPRYGWHDHDYGWRGRSAYDYGYSCHMVRERIDTPSGRVIFRAHRVCD
jgi:hypothetical protein